MNGQIAQNLIAAPSTQSKWGGVSPAAHGDGQPSKPAVVYFQYQYDKNLPVFLLEHMEAHVRCLSEFFAVRVISHDCDYEHICQTYEPELAIFELGENHKCHKPVIRNTTACPHVPKIGLINADSFSGSRAALLSAADHFGIETFFSIAVTAGEHLPEIAENLFYWPNFFDPSIFRDYHEWKSIPVLLTGNSTALYPWRRRVGRRILERLPALVCPHPGYGVAATVNYLVGERYAKTINSSTFVPTCGTIAKEVVRKHLEVPACKSCLVTEKSPALEAAGFRDMKNCVFVDEQNVIDKLEYLLQNPCVLDAIVSAGHALAHSRHALSKRSEFSQWLSLRSKLQAGERIIQEGPFEPLRIVPEPDKVQHYHIISHGPHLVLLSEGRKELSLHNYENAQDRFLRCLNYLVGFPEAKFGLALCSLYQGDAKRARIWLAQTLFHVLEECKAIDPDPVEWGYFIICHLCLGRPGVAIKYARKYPWLQHPELQRARWAVDVILNRSRPPALRPTPCASQRRTMHAMPSRSLSGWTQEICLMLTACRQPAMVEALSAATSANALPMREGEGVGSSCLEVSGLLGNQLRARYPGKAQPLFSLGPFSSRFRVSKRALAGTPWVVALRGFAGRQVRRLERRYGYFLPYKLSVRRKDDLFIAIERLAQHEGVSSALCIGARPGDDLTRALIVGAEKRFHKFWVHYLDMSEPLPTRGRQIGARHVPIEWHSFDEGQALRSRGGLKYIRDGAPCEVFDLVLLVGGGGVNNYLERAILEHAQRGAKHVVLVNTVSPQILEQHVRLIRDPVYVLETRSENLHGGYSVFRQLSPRLVEAGTLLSNPCELGCGANATGAPNGR